MSSVSTVENTMVIAISAREVFTERLIMTELMSDGITAEDEIPYITIYCDGACRPNPGKGGIGVVMRYKAAYRTISKGFQLTTNTRMEMTAMIVALEQIKIRTIPIKLYSDSKFVINGATNKNAKRKMNLDLWAQLDRLLLYLDVEIIWVKGHSGIPDNVEADKIAYRAAMNKDKHYIDYGYIDRLNNTKKKDS